VSRAYRACHVLEVAVYQHQVVVQRRGGQQAIDGRQRATRLRQQLPLLVATPASIGSISAVVLAELQFGISLGAPSRRDTNQDALDRFLNMVVVEDWPAEVADFYGEPYSLRVACSRNRFRRRRLQRRAAKAPRKGTGPGTSEGEGEGSPLLEKTPISVPRKHPGP